MITLLREYSYGWDLCNEDEPEFFSTIKQAEDELKGYIESVNLAYKQGYMSDPYEDDMKVGEVSADLVSNKWIIK
tara:strand:+ start:1433 stop:1657 length:225 start_codon:yes stop_codon:yes gene_type:complete